MDLQVTYRGGSSCVELCPIFSSDSKTIFVVCKFDIMAYNTKTGKLLRVYRGLTANVVGVHVYHAEDRHEYVTACSSKGELASWRTDIGLRTTKQNMMSESNGGVDASSIKEIIMAKPILLNSTDESGAFSSIFVAYRHEPTGEIRFGTYDVSNAGWKSSIAVNLMINEVFCAVGYEPTPYVAIANGRSLRVVNLSTHEWFLHGIHEDKNFTCIDCHPRELCVITGDTLGRIVLWYNLANKVPSTAIFHWHMNPVRCLSFSSTGTNFYSGGAECVLVKWDPYNPHFKQFLPRLPSELEQLSVAVENQYLAVSMRDNSIRIMDSQFETISLIQHLVLGGEYSAGMVYDSRTNSLVLNGLVGHLQFFCLDDMSLLYNLDVVNQNKLSEVRNKYIENTNVTRIAVDSSGLWLATVETRFDLVRKADIRLKFWLFNTAKQSYELKTSIEDPHQSAINSMQFNPSNTKGLQCTTVGDDAKFKVWHAKSPDSPWLCSKVGFFRDLPCNAFAYCSDGSLIAVSFGSIITVWNPETCELKCSLSHPIERQRIHTLHFGINNECHLLVAASNENITVWNLLSLTLTWSASVCVMMLLSSPVSPYMAAFTSDQKLHIFMPGSSMPIYQCSLDVEPVAGAIIPSGPISDVGSNWYRGFCLYFLSSRHELHSLDAEGDTHRAASLFTNAADGTKDGLLGSLLPKTKLDSRKEPENVTHKNIGFRNNQLKQLLFSPVHTMLPMSQVCKSFLQSVLEEIP